MTESKLRMQYIVEGGALSGTIIEPVLGFFGVTYPHRKTKDLYIPPMKDGEDNWHCCQGCEHPDFTTKEFLDHLEKHAGRLLKTRAVQHSR